METEQKRSRATESLGTGPEVSGHHQQPAMKPSEGGCASFVQRQ